MEALQLFSPYLQTLNEIRPILSNLRARVPEDVDAFLAELAKLAQRGDRQARNDLFLALRPRLVPMIRRLRWSSEWRDRAGRSWTFDDLEQETFLVVCELIDEWPATEDGIMGYLFSRLSWRLRDVLRRWTVPMEREAPSLPMGLIADDAIDLVEVRVVLQGIFDRLPAELAEILHLRALEGLRDEEIAVRLGVSPRTVRRRRHEGYQMAKAIYLGEDFVSDRANTE